MSSCDTKNLCKIKINVHVNQTPGIIYMARRKKNNICNTIEYKTEFSGKAVAIWASIPQPVWKWKLSLFLSPCSHA